MEGKIFLRPGTPDDANRDYLPESIFGSDIVVNENGNNSQPHPKNLVEKHEVLWGDEEDTWFEYVPDTYDPEKATPLVVSCHGGLMSGWGQCIYTSWTYVADREGFIVVFPNAHEYKFWNVWEGVPKMADGSEMKSGPGGMPLPKPYPSFKEGPDCNQVLALIENVKARFNIDPGRIFIQGMSMGGMMTSMMVHYFGEKFAGFATAGAPGGAPRGVKNAEPWERGPISGFISMPEFNGFDKNPDRSRDDIEGVRRAVQYWTAVNDCTALPEIMLEGEDNYFFYTGKKANFTLRVIRNRDHGQTLDDAELVWDYCFSGIRRDEKGEIIQGGTKLPRKGDDFGIALALGKENALVNSKPIRLQIPAFKHQKLKYHGLDGGELVRGEYFYAPVSFLAQATGSECNMSADGRNAELILRDGRMVEFAQGSIGCVIDNKIYSMDCEAVIRDGALCLPVEWFFRRLLGCFVSESRGVIYITDHYIELAAHTAALIEDILAK
ncbi:MAG: prolyl oligopeptidase family serine peptidase [Lachnospiraceae bacterium]|nr:prolyl oligopeptidase family serine peptidase [Lachnospiraceae bacterium]